MNPTVAETEIPASTTPVGEVVRRWKSTAWRDYFALSKPRITLMILLTVAVAMVFTSKCLSLAVSPWVWFSTLVGTSMVAASASVLNQWYERDRDSIMPRTQRRPLPTGRLTSLEASVFGWLLVIIGTLLLGMGSNWTAASVGLTTWFVYCWVYTPMKTWSWWNTAVGTLPGALPVLIGWTAAGGSLWDINGWALTAVVILWQFPHFMAIAWLYRDQYTQAGFRMLTREEPTGIAAAWHAIVPSVCLIPLSMAVLYPSSPAGWFVAFLGALSGWSQLQSSIRFLIARNNDTARKLLRASLVYLPAIMILVVIRWVFL